MMTSVQTSLVEAWVSKLSQHGHNATRPRRAVIDLLAKSEQALTAEQLVRLASIQDAGVGRATVYRTLQLLEKLHLVCRECDGGGHCAYVRSDLAMQPLAICEVCGDLLVMHSQLFERLLAELDRNSSFEVHGASLRMSGVCQTCQPQKP